MPPRDVKKLVRPKGSRLYRAGIARGQVPIRHLTFGIQDARVREGLSGGGITYGYVPVRGKRGERAIIEDEAAIVRRVFAEYVAGNTPRDIAIGLNRDGIRPPRRGNFWSASRLQDNRARGSGLLQCAIRRASRPEQGHDAQRSPDRQAGITREFGI
jgi:hypothetical protein